MVKQPNFFQRLFGAQPTEEPSKRVQIVRVQNNELGSSGTKLFSGYFQEEYLPDLQGVQAADVYDKMRRSDAVVKMVLRAIKAPIKRAAWAVEAATQEDPTHMLHKEFIEMNVLRNRYKSFKKTLSELLTVIDFGHVAMEITHEVVLNDPKWGAYNGLKKLSWRSPKTLQSWNVDESGTLLSVTQLAQGDVARHVHLDATFLLLITLDQEGDNYQGESMLRSGYGAWWRKNLYLKLMAIGSEKNAVPAPILKCPTAATQEQREEAKETLQAFTSNESNYIMIPAGYELDSFKSTFDPEKLKACIDFENTEIIRSTLANFLMLGSQSTGSYSLSFDQSDFFLNSLESIADMVCDAYNERLIPQLIDLNFGPQEAYPKLTVSGISDKAGKELAESLKALSDGKYIEPDDELEEQLRRRFGLTKKSAKGARKADASEEAGEDEEDDPIDPQVPQDPEAVKKKVKSVPPSPKKEP